MPSSASGYAPAGSGGGTEVRVQIGYQIPGGVIGKAAATVFGESPDQHVNDDLRRLKQILEGEPSSTREPSEGGTRDVK